MVNKAYLSIYVVPRDEFRTGIGAGEVATVRRARHLEPTDGHKTTVTARLHVVLIAAVNRIT